MVDPSLLLELKKSIPYLVVELETEGYDLSQPLKSNMMTPTPYLNLRKQRLSSQIDQILALLTWCIAPEDVVKHYLDLGLSQYQQGLITNYVRFGHVVFAYSEGRTILSQLGKRLFRWQVTLSPEGELVMPRISYLISSYARVPTTDDLRFGMVVNRITNEEHLFAWEFKAGQWLEIKNPLDHPKIHETLRGLQLVLELSGTSYNHYNYTDLVGRALIVLNKS